jgi:hypothetical protein
VQIFFLAFCEEKLNKLLDQQNISRISGILPYQISGTEYQKRRDYSVVSKISGSLKRIGAFLQQRSHQRP